MTDFAIDQRVKSRITGFEGIVMDSIELVQVKFDNGEVALLPAECIEEVLPDVTPPPIATFAANDHVVCTHPFYANGLTARVLHQDGGRVWVVWDKDHWKYAGQLDGSFSADAFAHFHESTLSQAA